MAKKRAKSQFECIKELESASCVIGWRIYNEHISKSLRKKIGSKKPQLVPFVV
jgi:hypothetical protein